MDRPSRTKNLIVNSSFEYSLTRGMPDRWGPSEYHPWEYGAFLGDPDAPWRLEEKDARHGTSLGLLEDLRS